MLLQEGCTPAPTITLMLASAAPAAWLGLLGRKEAEAVLRCAALCCAVLCCAVLCLLGPPPRPGPASEPSDSWRPSTSSESDWLRWRELRPVKERTMEGSVCMAATLCTTRAGAEGRGKQRAAAVVSRASAQRRRRHTHTCHAHRPVLAPYQRHTTTPPAAASQRADAQASRHVAQGRPRSPAPRLGQELAAQPALGKRLGVRRGAARHLPLAAHAVAVLPRLGQHRQKVLLWKEERPRGKGGVAHSKSGAW